MRFCILSMARTDARRLAALLDSHSQIVSHDALFEAGRPRWSRRGPVPTALDDDLDRLRDDPHGWLEAVFAATGASAAGARAIGFALHITARRKVLEHVPLDSDMKLVLVDRANRLAQYASVRAAAATGRHGGTEPSSPVAFDREDFLVFVEQQALAFDLARRLVTDQAHLFVIDYREIGTAEGNAALLTFLGQEARPLTAPGERNGSSGIQERFADLDAVAAALVQTVWRPWRERNGG